MAVELDTATLCDVVRALRAGQVSSVELLNAQLDRIDTFNPSVNAVVAFDIDRARRTAIEADEARLAGRAFGPLNGVPVTLKDTHETEGLVTTAGAPQLAGHIPSLDSDVVAGVREAGGIVFGKTNVPLYAGDHQTYNEVYGLSRNPWDPERTPGGSSGGAAAALACGFTTGEVGSDIGSSIRVPSHFNGVFGLKPSWGVVSGRGHIPGPPGALAETDLAVLGPLGRSVDDLSMLLDACMRIGGMHGVPGAVLPPAAPVDLGKLRVGLWATDAVSPVDQATLAAVEGFASSLAAQGAAVLADARPAVSSAELYDIYSRLLFAVVGAGFPPELRQELEVAAADVPAELDAGDPGTFGSRNTRDSVSSHLNWLAANERRAKAQAAWANLFETVDVMVMPVSQTQAFPHNTELGYADRVVQVDEEERAYHELLFWAGLATMPLLPSVVVPLGAVNGLPMGVQIVGPRWSDRTLLAVAKAACEALGLHFVPPPLVTG